MHVTVYIILISCNILCVCLIGELGILVTCSSPHLAYPLTLRVVGGATDYFTTSFLHFSRFSTALQNQANSRPILGVTITTKSIYFLSQLSQYRFKFHALSLFQYLCTKSMSYAQPSLQQHHHQYPSTVHNSQSFHKTDVHRQHTVLYHHTCDVQSKFIVFNHSPMKPTFTGNIHFS